MLPKRRGGSEPGPVLEMSLEPSLGAPATAVARGRWAAPQGAGGSDGAGVSSADAAARQEASGRKVNPASSSNKVVEVEALVLIKIMRHCREHFPTPVNGLLVGLDNEQKLEVTDCFGLQNKRDLWNQLAKEKLDSKEVDEKVLLEDMRYQLKMLDQLILVNADCCNVGWYQSLQFDDLKDQSVVEGLCEHQELVRDAIVIGFDPQLAPLGLKAFRAFRVTNEVLKCRAEAERTDATAYNSLKGRDVLVEAPLLVKNSLLVQAFLTDWLCADKQLQETGEWDALEEGNQALLMHKSLDFVSSCLDDLQMEQEKLMKFQRESVRQLQKQKEIAERRRLENEQRRLRNEELLPEILPTVKKGEAPSQLPTLILSNHVNRVAQKLSTAVGDNLARAVLLQRQLSTKRA